MSNELNESLIAKQFKDEIEKKMAEFIETQTKYEAQKASKRQRKFRGRNGKIYTYSKYKNTGQLASNIKLQKRGDRTIVSDGTRANYSQGYHGMYFIRNKKGSKSVQKILKDAQVYAKSIKL